MDKKIAIYLSLGFHKRRPSYRGGLQPSKENINYFKKWNLLAFFYVCGSFLPSWIRIRIANPDTDPGVPLNPYPIRIHNTGLKTRNVSDAQWTIHLTSHPRKFLTLIRHTQRSTTKSGELSLLKNVMQECPSQVGTSIIPVLKDDRLGPETGGCRLLPGGVLHCHVHHLLLLLCEECRPQQSLRSRGCSIGYTSDHVFV